jgi:hypothetical protein
VPSAPVPSFERIRADNVRFSRIDSAVPEWRSLSLGRFGNPEIECEDADYCAQWPGNGCSRLQVWTVELTIRCRSPTFAV